MVYGTALLARGRAAEGSTAIRAAHVAIAKHTRSSPRVARRVSVAMASLPK